MTDIFLMLSASEDIDGRQSDHVFKLDGFVDVDVVVVDFYCVMFHIGFSF